MTKTAIIDLISYVEPLACLAALILMQRRRQIVHFKYLSGFLLTRILSIVIMLPLLHRLGGRISIHASYLSYFFVYWISYAIEAMLGLGMVYDVYKLAMAPLRGLQTLGMVMFRWATAIAVAVAIGMAFGPNVSSHGFLVRAVTQLQQTQSILTLCLLLFVALAIRPMGLSFKSKIFGVSLGLGILASMNLIGSAWISQAPSMSSTFNLINSIMFCIVISTWMTYFALPEPKRRMIVLPTTSPFLRWNQISMALGDEPGFVAVGGIHPDMFAPAEVEIMRRASKKMEPLALRETQA
ncbi:hypothetical protein [Granulicella tundricola]|uniref:Uncharacterized protein n=1 Tax=Granulicella tundricola (strain ATCC BAA-1859 / DSM 23138 / MP5ACTX9) TaxID=1198114 RepID=E8X3D2_GRATM|nr:hypothetical protein [Granulicella tundricola]ADW70433.1 hypothetical protein AciX9_3427 [Granulicella tundricola MP5ACTX9]